MVPLVLHQQDHQRSSGVMMLSAPCPAEEASPSLWSGEERAVGLAQVEGGTRPLSSSSGFRGLGQGDSPVATLYQRNPSNRTKATELARGRDGTHPQ